MPDRSNFEVDSLFECNKDTLIAFEKGLAVDMDEKRFTINDIARAIDRPHMRLRRRLESGEWREIGDEPTSPGFARLYSARDALVFALASEVIERNYPATLSFRAGLEFAHMSDDDAGYAGDRAGRATRDPGELFAAEYGTTWMAIRGDEIEILHDRDLARFITPPEAEQSLPPALTLINLNRLVSPVISKLQVMTPSLLVTAQLERMKEDAQ